VLIGVDAFSARAAVQIGRPFAGSADGATEELASLGEIPITLPVVTATSSADTADVRSLAPGDIFLPGSGWTVHRGAKAPLVGEVLLAAPGADVAIAARLGDGGEFVVLGKRPVYAEAEAMTPDDTTATSEAVLEAPLVVRVEVGAVTMTAREWAALRAGDVVALGKRIGEPVALRVGGAVVARGELVDIEGEIGVRIREQVKAT
jgi:type III secretion system YscQ/HrcQ family protein